MSQIFFLKKNLVCILVCFSFFSCSSTTSSSTPDDDGDETENTDRETLIENVSSWVYQLQNMDADEIGSSEFDLVVIDYSADGSDDELNEQTDVIENLDAFVAAGKIILSVDYLTDSDKIDDFYERATNKSYIPYTTVRDLDAFTVNVGHEP